MTDSRKTKNNPSIKGRGEYSKASLDLPVLIYVLKLTTTPENPDTTPHIASEMQSILGEKYSARTLQRRMDMLTEATDWEHCTNAAEKKIRKNLYDLLYYVFGGSIRSYSIPGSVSKNPHKKYYFEPCLDESSMRMINGSVISNIFFSEEEKQFLLSRLSVINRIYEPLAEPEEAGDNLSGSRDPEENDDTIDFPGDSNRFLNNLTLIDRAIKNNLQIEITYGTYDIKDNCITYHERMSGDRPFIFRLNPYAHFWNNGHYYLLATYASGYKPGYVKEEGTPINFRIDRIIRVEHVKDKKDGKFIKREPVPERLLPFFRESETESGRYDFDYLKYSSVFPLMRISGQKKLITCRLECTAWSLQILIDTFGSLITVKESSVHHDKDELDYNGRKQTFIEAEIRNVEFENIRDFCLAHPEYITPTYPSSLVNAVKEKLTKILEKYEKISF